MWIVQGSKYCLQPQGAESIEGAERVQPGQGLHAACGHLLQRLLTPSIAPPDQHPLYQITPHAAGTFQRGNQFTRAA